MAITIDGVEITGATIDGTDVQEITIDGVSVWEAGPSHGDNEAGYYGTVDAVDFIDGPTLASDIGLTAGTAYNDDTPWLQFAWNGGIVMVPQKPLRHSISWDQIDAEDAVYGGTGAPIVTINVEDYKVRLFRVANVDPVSYSLVGSEFWDSEWNKLMLPIHANAPSSWAYPEFVDGSTEDWGIDFDDEDLLTDSSYGDGSYTWGQETLGPHPSYRVGRGYGGVSYANNLRADNTIDYLGWRPLLTQL